MNNNKYVCLFIILIVFYFPIIATQYIIFTVLNLSCRKNNFRIMKFNNKLRWQCNG